MFYDIRTRFVFSLFEQKTNAFGKTETIYISKHGIKLKVSEEDFKRYFIDITNLEYSYDWMIPAVIYIHKLFEVNNVNRQIY